MKDALARIRATGRKVRRLKNGRYAIDGVWPCVSAAYLEMVAAALEEMAK